MLKKWYIYIIPCLLLLFSFNTAMAAETYVSASGASADGTYITVGAYSHTNIASDGKELYEIGTNQNWVNTWHITQNIRLTGLTVGKYYNGLIKVTYQNNVSSTGGTVNYRLAEIENTNISQGLYAYVYGTGTVNIDIVFDNYYVTETQIGLPTINQLFYGETGITNISVSVSPAINASNLSSSTIPSTSGFAGVIEYMLHNAIEGSTALGMIYNVLDTIKTNDINYFSTLISQLTTSNTYLNSINSLTNSMLSELQSIDTTTTDTLTALTNYISFMQLHIPYLDNIATNTLNTYNQLVTILNYLINRPTHTYKAQTGILYYSNGMTSQTTSGNRFVINKDDNIEYIYVKNTYSDDTHYPVVLYFDEYLDGVPNNYPTRVVYNNTLTSGSNTSYDYITIDFKYNEKYVVVNTTDASGFKAYIGDGYTYNAIMYWIERNFQMNEEESSEAAAIESEYQDKSNQSESLVNSMNSVTMPTFAANDLDILESIDTDSKINFFGLIALITHNQLITKIMLVIVIGSFVGYILYGKKG